MKVQELYEQLKAGNEIKFGICVYRRDTRLVDGKPQAVVLQTYDGRKFELPDPTSLAAFVAMLRDDFGWNELAPLGIRPTAISLTEVYDGDEPDEDEMIWSHVGRRDFDTPFKVVVVNPVAWYNEVFNGSQTPKEVYEDYADPEQKELIAQYRRTAKQENDTRYVIVDDDQVVDGWHRMVAFALEGMTTANAVDLSAVSEEL